MKTLSKKTLTILLAIVLAFSLSMSAFAAWSSYQKNNKNNGTIDTATHMTASPTVTTYSLPNNGALYSGVDNTPVINGYKAYTLYNGGTPSGTNGGARLSGYTTNTGTSLFNIQVDSSADNVQQLSTPYLDTSTNTLYAATTYYANDLSGTGVSGWKDANNQQITSFSFSAGTTVIHYDGLVTPGDYWEPQLATDLTTALSGLSGSMTLTSGGNTYDMGTSSYWGSGNFTLYNMNSTTTMVPAGTYTLTVTINNSTGSALSASSIKFLTSNWHLYKVARVNTTSPTVTLLTSGYGQANTHINKDSGYLCFGIYEGDRCYYQYAISGGSLASFKPTGGADFYWAGSVIVTLSGTDYVVFGSDSGTVYVRPVGTGFSSGTGNAFTPSATSGQIRSSICYDGSTNLYYTSKGGYLWRVTASTLLNTTPTTASVTLANGSTCTPVVTSTGYVYAGSNNGWNAGAVQAVSVSSFNDASKVTVYSGDPVQSSVAAYSTGGIDYLYFTTNVSTGRGYCYSFNGTTGTNIWSTAAGTYTPQGMASDGGYLVFGNDANTLYIIAP